MLKVIKYRFIKPHLRLFLLIGLVMNISLIMEAFGIAMIFPLFTNLLGGDGIGEKLWLVGSFARYFRLSGGNLTVAIAIVIAIAFVLRTLFQLAAIWFREKTNRKVQNNIRSDVLGQFFTREYQFHIQNKKGKLFSDLYQKSADVGTFMNLSFNFVSSVIQILFMAIVLLWMSYKIFLVWGFFVVLLGFISKKMARMSYQIGQILVIAKEKMMSVPVEALQGIRELLLLNSTKLFLKSFNVYQKETTSYGLRVALLSNVSKPVAELFIVLILCFVIIFAKHFSFEFGVGNISIMLTSLILIQRISQAMASINSNYMGMMAALPSFDALEALYLEHEKSLIERTSEGKINIRAFNNKIQFEDVTFSYKKDSIVLDKLNLTFKRGEKSAIVGASGCGKSTTVDLITGLIVPPKGSITVDGIDLTTVNIQDWRQRIGFVSQDIFIFHDTVENNILFGRLDATMDEVIRAAKLANAHDFVTKLEKGYKTDIGEKGLRLSAGQRQRIGIARALIRNPEILIFDEATSALDTVSEKQVQEAIDKVSEFTTVISIAHRLSTIKNYDKIYVMEHGKVLEEGSHEELVSLNGAYSKLSSLQHTEVLTE